MVVTSLDLDNRSTLVSQLSSYVASEHGPALHQSRRPISESHLIFATKERGEDGKARCSHTFFRGADRGPGCGKACVSDDALDNIMTLYACDLLNTTGNVNMRTHMVEQANDHFPMFMDLDVRAHSAQQDDVSPERLRQYWRTITDVVARFYPDAPSEQRNLIVCSRQVLYEEKNQGFKFGWHLHWPHLIVDAQRALYIRELAVSTFVSRFGERNGVGCNSWNDVFDTSVIKNGGRLRAIGSHKKPREAPGALIERDMMGRPVTYWPCDAFLGTGQPDETTRTLINDAFPEHEGVRRPARLFAFPKMRSVLAQPDGDDATFIAKVMKLAIMVRIRIPSGTPLTSGFALFDGAPTPGRAAEFDNATAKRLKKPQMPPGGANDYEPANQNEFCAAAQAYIRDLREFDGTKIWPEVVVTKVFARPTRPRSRCPSLSLLVVASGVGSLKCLNLAGRRSGRRGGDHSSNHVYFLIGEYGVDQRCHCSSTTTQRRYVDRSTGVRGCAGFGSRRHCEDYVHNQLPLPPRLSELIRAQVDSPLSADAGAQLPDAKRPRVEVPLMSVEELMLAGGQTMHNCAQ